MEFHELHESAGSMDRGKRDLRVEVVPNGKGVAVFVPEDLRKILRRLSVSTAEELGALLVSFPKAFANELGWTTQELDEARKHVFQKLRGVVADEFLMLPPPPEHVYGARNPHEE